MVEKSFGIDFGLSRQLILSRTGIAIQYTIPVSTKLRKLARKLSTQELHSKNWNKTRIKLNKEYDKATNIKQDIKNKVVSFLKDKYGTVCFQDENVKAWQRSINIENEGLKRVGTVRTELTPVEIESSILVFLRYFNSIPYVKASSVNESGSFTALA